MTAIFNSFDNTAMGFATQWGRGREVHCFYPSKLKGLTKLLQDSRELKQRRFWPTHDNRKWGFFFFLNALTPPNVSC